MVLLGTNETAVPHKAKNIFIKRQRGISVRRMLISALFFDNGISLLRRLSMMEVISLP